MKRTTLVLWSSVLLLGASACAEPDAAILVTGHAPLEGSYDENLMAVIDCAIPTAIGDASLSQDVFINLSEVEASGQPFTLGLLMENRLVNSSSYAPIGEQQNQRLDQNHIEIQGYTVTFSSDEKGFSTLGGGSDGEIRYEATGILPTNGVLWAGVDLFYPNEVEDWSNAFSIASGGQQGAIVPTFAEVQVVGKTIGGSKVQSNVLTLPIQVCDDCGRSSTPICVIVN